jgi:hypothetical protein
MHVRALIKAIRNEYSSYYALESSHHRRSLQIFIFLCIREALSKAFTTDLQAPMHSRSSIKGVHNEYSSYYAFERFHHRRSQQILTLQCTRGALSKAFTIDFQAPMHSRAPIKGIHNGFSPFNAFEKLYQRHSQRIFKLLCTRETLSEAFTTDLHLPMHSRNSIKGI